jgi:hypothetical protein
MVSVQLHHLLTCSLFNINVMNVWLINIYAFAKVEHIIVK